MPGRGRTGGVVMPEGSTQGRLLRIVTRCSSVDEFTTTFERFIDETTIFIVTGDPRPVGVKQPFVITLSNGEALLHGEAEVLETRTGATGPRGMRLRFLRLDDRSRAFHRQIMEMRAARRSATSVQAA